MTSLNYGYTFNRLNVLLPALGVEGREENRGGCHQIEHGKSGNRCPEKRWLGLRRREEQKKLLLGVIKCFCFGFVICL